MEIGIKFFLHINKQVKGKNSKEKFLTGSAQIFLYTCLNIDRRITKFCTNDRYHGWRDTLFYLTINLQHRKRQSNACTHIYFEQYSSNDHQVGYKR